MLEIKEQIFEVQNNKKNMILFVICFVFFISSALVIGGNLRNILSNCYLCLFFSFFPLLGKYLAKGPLIVSASLAKELYIILGAIGLTILWEKMFFLSGKSLPEYFEFLSIIGVMFSGIAVQSYKKGIIETSVVFALFMTFGAPLNEYGFRLAFFYVPMTVLLPMLSFKKPISM